MTQQPSERAKECVMDMPWCIGEFENTVGSRWKFAETDHVAVYLDRHFPNYDALLQRIADLEAVLREAELRMDSWFRSGHVPGHEEKISLRNIRTALAAKGESK